MPSGLSPTKLPMTWDIEADHFDVPAFEMHSLSHGDETLLRLLLLGFLFQAVASYSGMETCYCIVTLCVSCLVKVCHSQWRAGYRCCEAGASPRATPSPGSETTP